MRIPTPTESRTILNLRFVLIHLSLPTFEMFGLSFLGLSHVERHAVDTALVSNSAPLPFSLFSSSSLKARTSVELHHHREISFGER